jgi:hypothetical protein
MRRNFLMLDRIPEDAPVSFYEIALTRDGARFAISLGLGHNMVRDILRFNRYADYIAFIELAEEEGVL